MYNKFVMLDFLMKFLSNYKFIYFVYLLILTW